MTKNKKVELRTGRTTKIKGNIIMAILEKLVLTGKGNFIK